MIEVRSLRKSFDGFTALDGLDISVPDGAVYGLVGPNGAGKSTLIRHMAGILRQDEGEVLYDGEAVFENPAVKAQIAYIPDEVFYYPGASVKDMMLLYRRMYPSFSEACPGIRHSPGEVIQAPFKGHAEAGGVLAGAVALPEVHAAR